MLPNTDRLCPIQMCAKSIVSGSCGGALNGKCKINSLSSCVWNEIFLITAELLPPRGTEVTELLKQAEELKPYVDAFILPDNPGAKLRAVPLGLVHILQSEVLRRFIRLPAGIETDLLCKLIFWQPEAWVSEVSSQ